MKKLHIIIITLLSFQVFSQKFQGTIKIGSTSSSYKVFLKSNQDYTGIFTNIAVTFQLPNSIMSNASIISNPTASTIFPTAGYALKVENDGTRNNYIFNASGNSINQTITSNTEFELFEVSFTGVSNAKISAILAPTDVRLAQNEGGGTLGNQVFYIQGNTVLSNDIAPFYGSGAVNNPPVDEFGTVGASYVSVLTTTLPLNLLSFTGVQANGNANLKWETTAEVNVDRFIIAKSTDGKAFVNIGEQKANGIGNEISAYNYSTEQKEEIAYYRLKMLDNDGKFEYSKIIALNNNDIKEYSLSVSPNPIVVDKVKVAYTSQQAMKGDLYFTAVNGEKISSQSIEIKEGSNTYEINQLGHLATGMYLVQIHTAKGVKSIAKVLK